MTNPTTVAEAMTEDGGHRRARRDAGDGGRADARPPGRLRRGGRAQPTRSGSSPSATCCGRPPPARCPRRRRSTTGWPPTPSASSPTGRSTRRGASSPSAATATSRSSWATSSRASSRCATSWRWPSCGRPASRAVVAPAGLKGVVVAETALGDVRGTEGFYHYRQYAAPELAAKRTFEDVVAPAVRRRAARPLDERAAFAAELAPLRHLPDDVLAALAADRRVGRRRRSPALRTAISLLAGAEGFPASLDVDHAQLRADALRLSAAVPTLIAALHRLRSGARADRAPRRPRATPRTTSTCSTARCPTRARARAIEQYLILGIDHGFNASTFVARAVTSTGADLGAAVVAALGSLSGPLHGGAPSRALDTLDAIGTPGPDRRRGCATRSRTGDRIMGFGHPVYRTADPALGHAARRSPRASAATSSTSPMQVETAVEETLAELKPGRRAAHQRRVVRRRGDGAVRPPPRPVHADLRGQPGRRLVRPRARAARGQPHHPPEQPLRRPPAAPAGARSVSLKAMAGGFRQLSPSDVQTSSMRAIGALSPWRGPSLRMRV